MRYTVRAVAVLMALVIGLMFLSDKIVPHGGTVYATTTREKIDQAEREKKDLENKQDQKQEDIDRLKGEQNTLKGKLNNLNAQLTEVANNLEDLERQIVNKEQEIEDTQEALEEAKDVEAGQYADMITRMRKMYERNDTSYVNMFIDSVMDAGSFSDALYTADGFEKIASYDKRKLAEFKENRRLIEEHEALLQQEKTELDNLHLKAETEKNKISGLIGQTSSSISAYAGEISHAEKEAAEYEAKIKQKEEDLEALWEQLRKEIALSQAAAKGVWRDISEVSFAEGDRYLLANLIYCEAGAEPYAGQVAVGSVVINRVLSGAYPDSVVGVIYQNKQFSPVASGRLDLALAANRATQSCYQAADEAMSGVSNVGNCVYFRTPIEGLTGINIGGHVFY
ncbi:MAG: cell wall hydrolase [Lachnospiraceae bacterium]|nr:cell wall hydrolase [Lachnospiraceae bacterium]